MRKDAWECVKSRFGLFFLVDHAEQRLPLIACFNHCSNYVEQRLITVNTTLPQS